MHVQIRNPRGYMLVGTLSGPLSDSLIISCHGMLSSRHGHKHQLLERLLLQREKSLFRFDFAGIGDSEGELYDLSYSNEMDDLLAVIEHFAGLGVHRFALFGSSMGGSVALLAAAREERVVAVATLAAVAHPGRVAERNFEAYKAWQRDGYVELPDGGGRIGKGYLEDAQAHDIPQAASVLRAPVLVYHGELDDVVPCSDGHDIAAAVRNVQLEIVPGADHRFSNPVHLRPAMAHIADFLSQHLERGQD